ncbi:MAG: hypothetical protein H0V70_03260 [Ktedonobacteraceae bacterium]|nr:hypothetical protein [Ktedonobacteraceae bacterium]
MPTQHPSGPSRRTLIALLTLYLLSIGTSALFLSHYIDIPRLLHIKGMTVPNGPVAPQGKHPAVVYFYNEMGGDGFLMLYKVSTGQKVQLLRLENTTIEYAQVSPDGQWILFTAGNRSGKAPYQL